jgi:hypothetical protein
LLGAAQFFPVAFTLALGVSPLAAALLALATISSTQRAQEVGVALGVLLFLVARRRLGRPAEPLSVERVRGRRLMVFMVVVTGSWAVATYGAQVLALLVEKWNLLGTDGDDSAVVRLAHIAGYWQLVMHDPLASLIGIGPFVEIYNAVLGKPVSMVEMVVFMYIVWYGWLYTAAFCVWYARALVGLPRPAPSRLDVTLAPAAIILFLVGNANPVLHTPLAFILLGLLRARRLELASPEPTP